MKKTTKSVLLSLTTLALASELQANGHMPEMEAPAMAPATCDYYRTGFYAGLKGGYSYMHNKFEGEFVNLLGVSYPGSKTKNDSGGMGTLFLGWEKVISSDYVLGLELEGYVDSNKTSTTLTLNNTDFKLTGNRRWGVMPSVKAGKVFANKILGYLKLGLSINSYSLNINDIENGTTSSENNVKLGLVPAIGIQYPIMNNVAILGELAYGFTFGNVDKKILRDPASPTIDYFTGKMKNMQHFSAQVGFSVKLT